MKVMIVSILAVLFVVLLIMSLVGVIGILWWQLCIAFLAAWVLVGVLPIN